MYIVSIWFRSICHARASNKTRHIRHQIIPFDLPNTGHNDAVTCPEGRSWQFKHASISTVAQMLPGASWARELFPHLRMLCSDSAHYVLGSAMAPVTKTQRRARMKSKECIPISAHLLTSTRSQGDECPSRKLKASKLKATSTQPWREQRSREYRVQLRRPSP